MKYVEGGVTAPKSFRAAGVAAGIKPGSTKLDCALVASDVPATVAGAFTTNRFKSPPAQWSNDVCAGGRARAVFINSGNANACTGEPGHKDAQTTAGWVAQGLGITAQEVCVASTGVIGVPLPMDRVHCGVRQCLDVLAADGSAQAARAIMTTDTVPKEVALEIELSGGTVRLGAIAKGSGMIAPNMATMICVITTDAAVEAGNLSAWLRNAVEVSFNRICVDNDMSTSDTVLCLANGASGVELVGPDADRFQESLTALCQEVAQRLVRDGEGATKFVTIEVAGAPDAADAKRIARAIAHSQLCKTAFFGQDPNWGRFACAAGYAGVPFDPASFNLWLDDVQLVKGGGVAQYREEDAAARMRKPEFLVRVSVGNGPGEAVYWTSDLSHDYVSINADYRS
ncbi:MAG TPA: bifunctional glutamate N-acetyltransferase/amino-acid acetyltransferase ArgJ [Candidatus Hydrogenedentes bacterium]|nr:bifunctional glutamate N-acetyltransferase/amino-acid acetyltransferase ArgJ [Candidatus Hydrogenedentota bacterium]HPG68923.1 bifunctional glutamate N-acetyltransferase/amino-acid acetyltransferase ArgJ [Candidatus Hydrogenedentota bacterium]